MNEFTRAQPCRQPDKQLPLAEIFSGDVRLFAMPESAEIVIVMDSSGAFWHLRPGRPEQAQPITPEDAERISAKADFKRYDEGFGSLEELDTFRHAVAAGSTSEFEIDLDKYAVEQLCELLAVAHQWAAEGLLRDALLLARDLLAARPTARSPEFRDEVGVFIKQLEQLVTPPGADAPSEQV